MLTYTVESCSSCLHSSIHLQLPLTIAENTNLIKSQPLQHLETHSSADYPYFTFATSFPSFDTTTTLVLITFTSSSHLSQYCLTLSIRCPNSSSLFATNTISSAKKILITYHILSLHKNYSPSLFPQFH